MSGYCIDHDKHFLDTCPSCQEKKGKGPKDCIYKNEDCPICPMARKETCCRKIQCEPLPVPTNPERSEGKGTEKCDGPGYPNQHTSPAVWCTCKDYAPAKLEWEEKVNAYIDSLRESSHLNYNGGHHEGKTHGAFHQGMDTICNVLNAGDLHTLIRQLLLSSRQSAIEECVKAVEKMQTTEKLDTALMLGGKVHHDYRTGYKWGAHDALSALRLLREESEDKKDE